MEQRGLFIVFEGTDGSGISTQAAMLSDWFNKQGRHVYATKEPSQGPAGALLRLALANRLVYPPAAIHGVMDEPPSSWSPLGDEVMALLYAADRMDHLRQEVEPRLARGISVICDRYIFSSLAYQSLTADLEWVRALNSKARRPDVTVFLDVPIEIGKQRMARRGGGVELYEEEAKLRRVRDNYLRLVAAAQAAGETVLTVDGSADAATVAAAVVTAITPYLP